VRGDQGSGTGEGYAICRAVNGGTGGQCGGSGMQSEGAHIRPGSGRDRGATPGL
jgi:hypothetical protein